MADDWFESRHSVKRKTRETDRAAWKSHIEGRFGDAPVASITPAEIAHWVGGLVSGGCAPPTASRYLATLRSILAYAVADGRVSLNAAASVRAPTAGHVRRAGQFLTRDELEALAATCRGVYADVVKVLGLTGLRWGELAGLQVGDRIAVPGPGLRLQRSVLASSKGGELFVDTLKGKRSRTVPLVAELVSLVDAWAQGKQGPDWLFGAPRGGPLSESNFEAVRRLVRRLRVHRPTHLPGPRPAAHLRLPVARCRCRPKVVQRILGHASAAMTMGLYGHLIDHNLWAAAERIGGTTRAPTPLRAGNDEAPGEVHGL